jgi:hypothetical protein
VILLGSLDGRRPELGLDSTFVTIRGERRRRWIRIHVVLNWLEKLERRVPSRRQVDAPWLLQRRARRAS